ncbi:alpha/beta hydrolase [Pendulispora albinea]|uniref:Alpha/beta hydrolase n=1 Tax=Pendulispora albinea TaxID=2741071 RepID=A0ABZ2MBZ0_9BACT
MPLPLDWDHPRGETIDIFVRRLPAAQPSGRQAWLLAGGPGGSGLDMLKPALTLHREDPTVDVYLPDHRGTGQSHIFGCPNSVPLGDRPDALSFWAPCIDALEAKWGAGLAQLTTTNAAHDLGALIGRTRRAHDEVHVLGISYGTIWAQRYLQFFPRQATSVTLDGLVHTPPSDIFGSDTLFDKIARELMQGCGTDPFCAGKLGPHPEDRLRALHEALDAGTCAPLAQAGVTRKDMRNAFATLLSAARLRVLIPAVTYRALRCGPADVEAVKKIALRFRWQPSDAPWSEDGFADALYMHIILSEISAPTPPSLEELQRAQAATFASADESTLLRKLYDIWPRYPHDRHVAEYPDTRVPMLLLNGTLDPQTRIEDARQIAGHYTRPNQTFISVPNAGHPVMSTSYIAGNDRMTCGEQMWISFMKDPRAPIDPSCMGHLRGFAFEGTPQLAKQFLGTADLWENTP